MFFSPVKHSMGIPEIDFERLFEATFLFLSNSHSITLWTANCNLTENLGKYVPRIGRNNSPSTLHQLCQSPKADFTLLRWRSIVQNVEQNGQQIVDVLAHEGATYLRQVPYGKTKKLLKFNKCIRAHCNLTEKNWASWDIGNQMPADFIRMLFFLSNERSKVLGFTYLWRSKRWLSP